MILCLDVGNTQIYGGVFNKSEILLQFRRSSHSGSSSDELGIFLRSVLRENKLPLEDIKSISICSVVPNIVYSLRKACRNYFGIDPFFLQAGVKTGLKIHYRNPLEVGADRIANAIAAVHLFPNNNIIVVDFGTATTFCAISNSKVYMGGVILAGLRLCMEGLEARTAKLPSVEILAPTHIVGRSTVESIQSGLYHSNIGAVKEIVLRITQECFSGEKTVVIGTGGFAHLFDRASLFDYVISDLVLQGLHIAYRQNINQKKEPTIEENLC